MKLAFSLQFFKKWEPSSWWTDRETDTMKLVVAFRNFAYSVKNSYMFRRRGCILWESIMHYGIS